MTPVYDAGSTSQAVTVSNIVKLRRYNLTTPLLYFYVSFSDKFAYLPLDRLKYFKQL